MKTDSHEFLVKTNREVDEWMDSFYTDGRKAEFRSHCQWTWQEQERRKEKETADLRAALESLILFTKPTKSNAAALANAYRALGRAEVQS